MAAHLPAPRVVIASNNSEGKSVISSDTTNPLFGPFGPNASQFATLYTTDVVPASNTAPLPSSSTSSIPRPTKNGTVFCTSDMPPNMISAFHRTQTLDYMVVLKGQITLRVDDGKEVTVGEGEMVVNRGNIHAWINNTNEWTRMLFFMLDAEKVVLEDGRALEDEFHPHKPTQ